MDKTIIHLTEQAVSKTFKNEHYKLCFVNNDDTFGFKISYKDGFKTILEDVFMFEDGKVSFDIPQRHEQVYKLLSIFGFELVV